MCPGPQQPGTEEAAAAQEQQQPEGGAPPAAAANGVAARKGAKGAKSGANGKGEEGGCGGPKRRTALICLSVLIVLFFVGCLLLIFLPCLPPHLSFPEYNATLPRPLTGRQLPKDWLSGATPVKTEIDDGHDGEELTLMGPESLARRGGNLFTGILGGNLLKLTPHNGGFKLSNLTKFGELCQDISEGLKCGRPMGMRFHTDGLLYVTDAYLGLYSVNVETGEKTRLAESHDYISGHRTMLANDLDIAKDGTVYWSDASTNVKVEDVILEFMSEPSGRLIRYDPVKKKSEALIRRVQCANGVQLSPDEDFVLVAEGGKDRILRYYLKGPKTGSSDVFIDGLPGVPDKIRRSGRPEGGYLVWCIISHGSAAKGSSGGILPWLRKHRIMRKMLMRGLFILESMFQNAHMRFGDSVSQKVIYSLGSLSSMAPFLLSEGLVLELDAHGNITGSFYSADRSVHMGSEMHVLPGGRGGVKGLGSIYVASPVNPHLLQVPIREGPMMDMAIAYSMGNTAPEPRNSQEEDDEEKLSTITPKIDDDPKTRSHAKGPHSPSETDWDRDEVHKSEVEVIQSTVASTKDATGGFPAILERRVDEGDAETTTAQPVLNSLVDMVATWVTNWRENLRTTSEPSPLESFFATAETATDSIPTTWSPTRDEVDEGSNTSRPLAEGTGAEEDDDKGNLVLEDPILRFLLGGKKKTKEQTVKVDLGQNDTVVDVDEDEDGEQSRENEKNFIALDSIIDVTTVTTPSPTTEEAT